MLIKKSKWKISRLFAALPALFVLAAGTYLAARPRAVSSNQLDWCQSAAQTADDNSDYKTASVCYARLLQSQPLNAEYAFSLAVNLEATGQHESARSLMARIASSDNNQFVAANVWLASHALLGPNVSPQSMSIASKYLVAASSAQPDDPMVNYWIAILDARCGNWDAVEIHAKKATTRSERLQQSLRTIAISQGNISAGWQWGQPPN